MLYSSCLRIVRELVLSGAAAASISSVLEKDGNYYLFLIKKACSRKNRLLLFSSDDSPLLEMMRIAAYSKEPCLQCYGLQLMVSLELEGLATYIEEEVELVITTLFGDESFFVRTPPVYVKVSDFTAEHRL